MIIGQGVGSRREIDRHYVEKLVISVPVRNPGDIHYCIVDCQVEEEPGPDGYIRVKLPNKKKNEIFGIVDQSLGGGHLKVFCQDGKMRLGRIRGKLKKRMWMREKDMVIIQPWDFQDEKANIQYRYTRTQAMYLSRKKMLPKSIDIF